MSVILQVNFTPSATQLAQAQGDRLDYAKTFLEVPGLLWKLWLQDDAAPARGGLYLFADRAAAQNFAEQTLRGRLEKAGASDITLRIFDVNETLSAITQAPLAPSLKAA